MTHFCKQLWTKLNVSCREMTRSRFFTGLSADTLAMIWARAAWMPHALWVAYGLHGSDTRVIRHKKWDDLLTPRSLQFFNSPNIHTCTWMHQIGIRSNLSGICPLEVSKTAIFCPRALSRTLHSIWKNQPQSSAHAQCVMGCTYNSEKQIVSMRGCILYCTKYWKRNWTNDCCF